MQRNIANTTQAWRIPADTKSLFSNGVPTATAAALEALLLGPLGFVQSDSYERVSLNLQDVAAGAGYSLSLNKRGDGCAHTLLALASPVACSMHLLPPPTIRTVRC